LTLLDGTSLLQLFCFMHHSSTCGMDVTMLLIVLMIHIICVFHTIHMAHIIKWEQLYLWGMWDIWTCDTFCAYGVCGTCVTYEDEKCGTIVADVAYGTYVTHVPYSQVVHTWMDLPNEYKNVFTYWSKMKIMSIPNV
jgi:hypothetical protein